MEIAIYTQDIRQIAAEVQAIWDAIVIQIQITSLKVSFYYFAYAARSKR